MTRAGCGCSLPAGGRVRGGAARADGRRLHVAVRRAAGRRRRPAGRAAHLAGAGPGPPLGAPRRRALAVPALAHPRAPAGPGRARPLPRGARRRRLRPRFNFGLKFYSSFLTLIT